MYKGMRKWQPFQLSLPGAVGGRLPLIYYYRIHVVLHAPLTQPVLLK